MRHDMRGSSGREGVWTMTNQSGFAFNQRIQSILDEADIPFVTDAEIGGLRPDFLIIAPDGSKIVIEVKAWQKQPGFRQRAIHQAKLYQEVVGADYALVVVEDLERSRISEGVVTADRLVDALNMIFAGQPLATAELYLAKQKESKETVFAAMPFRPRYDDVFFFAMRYAARSIGAVTERVDRQEFSSDIVAQITSSIRASIAVIVDLSESNPNVLYEAGLAHAWDKPTVHICSTPLEDLPFDVRQLNTIQYEMGRINRLQEPLAKRLQAIIH